MHQTVFSTPILTPCLRFIANCWLKLSGWKVIAEDCPPAPYVIIAVPHTSNWDFLLMLLAVFHLKLDISWMGKHSLFPPLLGNIMKWLGGIPIDRSKANSVVSQTVTKFNENPELIVLIPPEGTRKKVNRWKSGFYHIALQAKVPVIMVGIDGDSKRLHFVGSIEPNGELENEISAIQAQLQEYRGLIPENAWNAPE